MKRKLLIFLIVAVIVGTMLPIRTDALWVSEHSPYATIETAYTEGVSRGSIRYISQIPGAEYFNRLYWPSDPFGGYKKPQNECGTASISMALSYIGINKTPETILQTNNGYTYFDGWGAETSTPSVAVGMRNYLSGNGTFSPVIIHLPNHSAAGHWVVLIGQVRENVYQVLDPATSAPWNITVSGSSAQYVKDGRTVYDTIDRTYQYYNAESKCPSQRFYDVSTTAWYHESVDFVLSRGLFGGMSERAFEPDTAMTRAMIVTVLWRYAGQRVQGVNRFSDVQDGQWYTAAVSWASYHGIVRGIGNDRFAPDGYITREQLATVLYRFARFCGFDISQKAELNVFPDAEQVSAFALEAMRWAAATGLIDGADGRLLPQGKATRAQAATVLMRFIETVVLQTP